MRRLVPLIASFLLGLMMISPAMAQDASPTPAPLLLSPSALGVSAFDMSINADGFDAPDSVPAGQYLINVTNNSDQPASASFMLPPAGMTTADVQTSLDSAASSAEAESDPTAFNWVLNATLAGGTISDPGEVGQAVVALSPGTWVIWSGDPGIPMPLKEVIVTGEMPPLKVLVAPVTITAVSTAAGYAFAIEGDLVAGPQLVKWVNKTDQPHFVADMLSPVSITADQFLEVLMMPEDATPMPDSGLPGPNDFMETTTGLSVISTGVVMYGVLDMPVGTNILVCWVQDFRGDGVTPHAMEGMVSVVEVS